MIPKRPEAVERLCSKRTIHAECPDDAVNVLKKCCSNCSGCSKNVRLLPERWGLTAPPGRLRSYFVVSKRVRHNIRLGCSK